MLDQLLENFLHAGFFFDRPDLEGFQHFSRQAQGGILLLTLVLSFLVLAHIQIHLMMSCIPTNCNLRNRGGDATTDELAIRKSLEEQIVRRLILLRHTKSDWPDGVADHDRPLAKRGLRAGSIMGAYMMEASLTPDLAIVSTAHRTQETWALACPAFVAAIASVDERRIYEAPARKLLAVIREIPNDVRTLLLVGHNPGLEDLAAMLIGAGAENDLARLRNKYPTGGLAVIDFDLASWSAVAAGSGTLDRFVTPRLLALSR